MVAASTFSMVCCWLVAAIPLYFIHIFPPNLRPPNLDVCYKRSNRDLQGEERGTKDREATNQRKIRKNKGLDMDCEVDGGDLNYTWLHLPAKMGGNG
jgi:hypothetical protein